MKRENGLENVVGMRMWNFNKQNYIFRKSKGWCLTTMGLVDFSGFVVLPILLSPDLIKV